MARARRDLEGIAEKPSSYHTATSRSSLNFENQGKDCGLELPVTATEEA
jgi:hypothetical protein